MLILQKKFRSPRHLPYLWIVLGKSTLYVTHPAVSPSLMFSRVQWGLCHMAKLVLYKAALCTPDLAMKILKFGWRVAVHVLKLALKWFWKLLLAHELFRISYLQKISQLSSGDSDRWQSPGHIVTFADHVSYRARYLWFINIEFWSFPLMLVMLWATISPSFRIYHVFYLAGPSFRMGWLNACS